MCNCTLHGALVLKLDVIWRAPKHCAHCCEITWDCAPCCTLSANREQHEALTRNSCVVRDCRGKKKGKTEKKKRKRARLNRDEACSAKLRHYSARCMINKAREILNAQSANVIPILRSEHGQQRGAILLLNFYVIRKLDYNARIARPTFWRFNRDLRKTTSISKRIPVARSRFSSPPAANTSSNRMSLSLSLRAANRTTRPSP